MDTVLLVIHMILAIALVLVIMMQRAPQDGGGLTGGGTTMGGLFTARGSANLLTRVTSVLAVLFICTSLLMGVIASQQHKQRNVAQNLIATEETKAPEVEVSKEKDVKDAPKAADKKEEAKPAPQKTDAPKNGRAATTKPVVPVAAPVATTKKIDEKDSAGIKIEERKVEKKAEPKKKVMPKDQEEDEE